MQNTQGQQVIHCPNCGGRNVGKLRNQGSAISSLVFWGMVIPVFGWVTLLPIGIIKTIINYTKRNEEPVHMACTLCRFTFKVHRETFDRYNRAVGRG